MIAILRIKFSIMVSGECVWGEDYTILHCYCNTQLRNSRRHETDGNGRCYNLPWVSLELIFSNIEHLKLFLSHVRCEMSRNINILHCTTIQTTARSLSNNILARLTVLYLL